MLKPHLILRNVLALGTGQLIDRLLAMLLVIYLARALGASAFGMIGIALTMVHFCGSLVNSGSLSVGARATAQGKEPVPDIYGRITGFRLPLGLLFFGLGLLALPWSRDLLGIDSKLAFAYLLFVPLQALWLFWLFGGLEKMHLIAGVVITRQTLVLLVTIALVDSADDLLRVPIIDLSVVLLVMWWGQRWARKHFGPLRPTLRPAALMQTAYESLNLGISNLFRQVNAQGDVVLLGMLTAGTALAGEFLASQRIVLTLQGFSYLLIGATSPATARLVRSDLTGATDLQNRVTRFNLTLFMPAVLLGVYYADGIVALFYGDDFAQTAMVLRFMLWTIPVAIVIGSLQELLVAAAVVKPILYGSMLSAIAHVALAFLLIPDLGLKGAIAANLVAMFLLLGGLLLAVRSVFGRTTLNLRTLGPLAATGIGYLMLMLGSAWPWPLQAFSGLSVYLLAILLAGIVTWGELRSIADMLPNLMRSKDSVEM
jgi:O-antigen/teichoic acid export membrane protein